MQAGDIVVMLNSGDTFYNDAVLNTVSAEFERDKSLQWLHSKYELHRGDLWIIIGKPFAKIKNVPGNEKYMSPDNVCKKSIARQIRII